MNEHEIAYRLRFTKGAEVKYIGHLDVMRLFQRAIRRAGLPVAYSKGFNPHQLLSFANPLSLGMTSEGEYGDFVMAAPVDEEDMKNRLNATLPAGVRVLSVIRLKNGAMGAMASVEGARYRITLPAEGVTPTLAEEIASYMAQKEIIAMKKTKKNLKPTDIRPDIFSMRLLEGTETPQMELFLAAGSNRNVKAELVMQNFYEFRGLPFNWFAHGCCREELFRLQGEDLVPLDAGDIIEEF